MAEGGGTSRRTGQRGVAPLSARVRARLLAGLLARADAGDAAAAEALIRLGLQRESGALSHAPAGDTTRQEAAP